MGLDMFLERYTDIGMKYEDMCFVTNIINDIQMVYEHKDDEKWIEEYIKCESPKAQIVVDYVNKNDASNFYPMKADYEAITGVKGANKLKEYYYEPYEWTSSLSFEHEVAYWRKANQIHAWFVDNVQNGEDECNPYPVSKEQLIRLQEECKMALTSPNPENILPTQSGFFFGNTEYNEWYYKDLKDTIKQLDKILDEMDFNTERIVYQSSW